MRARMALKLANITVEIREISLRNKPQHMLRVSPKGTVPVLVLPDGTVMEQSLDIMNWAFEQADFKRESELSATGLEHSSASLQANIHAGCGALILINDTEFKNNLDCYKYPERALQHDLKPNHAQLNLNCQLKYRAQGEVFLQQLETLLQANSYLFANTPSFANIAIFPFIRQFAMVDSTWFENSNYPKLRAWLHNWVDSSLFKSVMTKDPTFVG